MTTRLLIGIAIGAAAVWLWDHRSEISFLYNNQSKISGADKIFQGLKEIGLP